MRCCGVWCCRCMVSAGRASFIVCRVLVLALAVLLVLVMLPVQGLLVLLAGLGLYLVKCRNQLRRC